MATDWNRIHSKEKYLSYDALDGSMDVSIKLRKTTICKIRKPTKCVDVYGKEHNLKVGTLVQRDKCLLDGEFGVSYICLDCLDKHFKEEEE